MMTEIVVAAHYDVELAYDAVELVVAALDKVELANDTVEAVVAAHDAVKVKVKAGGAAHDTVEVEVKAGVAAHDAVEVEAGVAAHVGVLATVASQKFRKLCHYFLHLCSCGEKLQLAAAGSTNTAHGTVE